MKLVKQPCLIQIGFCAATCLILAACGQAGLSKKVSPQAAKQARLDWNLKTLVGAYRDVGNTDPDWDNAATNALTEFARDRSHALAPGEPAAEIIATNCDAAIRAGCDDPMVRYLYIRFSMSQTNSAKFFLGALDHVETAMQKSSYPSIRKYYVSLRDLKQCTYTYDYSTNSDTTKPWQIITGALSELVDSLNDKTMPPEEVYEACTELLYSWPGDMKSFDNCYQQIEKPLFANWPNESISWLLKGQAYNIKAVIARGNGYANTVTKEGWKGFAENLAIAEKALNRAWELNPKDPQIAVSMIWTEGDLDKGRDQIDLWFNRAMKNDPNDYTACGAKLNFIEPKYGGSVGDMLDFGRECVQNTNWGGYVPITLVDVHNEIYNQYIDPSDRTNYWNQPDVWADVKAAYDHFFELNPNATDIYKNYAWHAYHAEQWDAFIELAPKVRPVDYNFFGDKDEFDKMVQLALEHASPPANPP